VVALVLVFGGAYNVTSNEEANEAKSTLDTCQSLDLATSDCTQAQKDWDKAIGSAWSLSAIGLLACVIGGVEIQRPDENGNWPSKSQLEDVMTVESKKPTSRHSNNRKGSWKSRTNEEE
jgi:hypothetical protein